jgi:hypothetical protein
MALVRLITHQVPGAPVWFDSQAGLFRSLILGSDYVDDQFEINFPVHLRLCELACLAHKHSVEPSPQHLEVASAHARLWAQAIVSPGPLPVALCREGPLSELDAQQQVLLTTVDWEPGADQATDTKTAEALLCANAPLLFLKLWQLTDDEVFLKAAERLLDTLLPQLDGPQAGVLAYSLYQYTLTVPSERYRSALLALAAPAGATRLAETLELELPRPPALRPAGVGLRRDQPRWLQDGKQRLHDWTSTALAACLGRDAALAAQACQLATHAITLARLAMPSGVDAPGSARSVAALLSGHDREAGIGLIAGLYWPIRKTFL